MTKDEALEIALDYVNRTAHWTEGRDRHDTLKAIKEALAQPVLKPCRSPYCECTEGKCTHPGCYDARHEPLEYWNAVEGWVKIDEVRQHFETVSCGTIYKTAGEGRVPLYTTPPQREWVGLTEEEFQWCGDENFPMIRVAEMLKEKNT